MIDDFRGAENHGRYVAWLEQNPHGFVLHWHSATMQVLHRVSCRSIGGNGHMPTNGSSSWTTRRKQCSPDRDALCFSAPHACRQCRPC
jgi:hypothetical protein